MSAETKAAMDAAIEAHFADECENGIVTGYVLQAQYVTAGLMDEGRTGYVRSVRDGQNYTTSLGLARYADLSFAGMARPGSEE